MTSETAVSSKRNLLVAMAVIGHVASHKSSYRGGPVYCASLALRDSGCLVKILPNQHVRQHVRQKIACSPWEINTLHEILLE